MKLAKSLRLYWSKRNKKEKVYFSLFAIALVIFFCDRLIWSPIYLQIKDNKTSIKVLSQSVKELNEKRAKFIVDSANFAKPASEIELEQILRDQKIIVDGLEKAGLVLSEQSFSELLATLNKKLDFKDFEIKLSDARMSSRVNSLFEREIVISGKGSWADLVKLDSQLGETVLFSKDVPFSISFCGTEHCFEKKIILFFNSKELSSGSEGVKK